MVAGVLGHMVNALAIAVIVNVFNATTLLQGIGVGFLVCIGFIVPVETGELVGDWVIAQGGLISLIVAGTCLSNILYWRKPEEEKLVTQFGEDHQVYRKQTYL